jgi:WD40 repeat protein
VLLSNNNLASVGEGDSIKIWDLEWGELVTTFPIEGVLCMAELPSKDELAVGRYEHCSIKILNKKTGQVAKKFHAHCVSVSSLLVLDEDHLASGSFDDHKIKIWNVKSEQLLRTLVNGHELGLYVTTNGALASCDEFRIRFWNWQTGQLISTVKPRSMVHFFLPLKKSPFMAMLNIHFDDEKIEIWSVN